MQIRPILVFLCIVLTNTTKIPCQFNSQTWESNNTYRLSSRQIVVTTRYGFDMIVDQLDQTVSKTIIEKGTWNVALMHIIALFLNPGMNVLNLGPQTGLEAIMIGRIIGATGQLFVFQPYTPSYAMVKKNIYLNDLEDISRIYKVGAGDVQSQQKMLIFYENTGGAEIYSLADFPTNLAQREYEEEIVHVDKVDNVLPDNITIDLALIDVEKMQVEALLGMRKTIERSKNIVIIVEWQYQVNSHRNEQKAIRCINWLTQLKFKFYQYKENTANKCQIGTFQEIKDPLSLLSIPPLDLIIVPSHINPNTLK